MKTKQGNPDPKPANGRRTFKKLPRLARRWWKPTDDTGALTGAIVGREERETKFGRRAHYTIRAEEAGEDSKGAFQPGDLLLVREWAGLRVLETLSEGDVVRITPAGLEEGVTGRSPAMLFDVEVAEV